MHKKHQKKLVNEKKKKRKRKEKKEKKRNQILKGNNKTKKITRIVLVTPSAVSRFQSTSEQRALVTQLRCDFSLSSDAVSGHACKSLFYYSYIYI